jgi:hypothetical protein
MYIVIRNLGPKDIQLFRLRRFAGGSCSRVGIYMTTYENLKIIFFFWGGVPHNVVATTFGATSWHKQGMQGMSVWRAG